MLGCKAAAGIPVSDISKETQISRTYIYQQKANVQNYIETLDKAEDHVFSIKIDKRFIERMVLSLSLDCHASTEGIRRNLASVFGLHISYGKISSILAEASEHAEQFDAGIPLEGITQGANDEIFQGNIPVLTGIDTESTYVCLLSEAGDRSAGTWQLFMEERKEQGLGLEVSISDAGTGLIVELTGFSGYTFQDACGLAEWVLSEMEASFPGRTKLLGQTKKIRGKLPQILSFLQRMEEGFAAASQKRGIPPEAFHIMYQQKAFHASS